MSDALSTEVPERRRDYDCICFDGAEDLWGPACRRFNNDDTGICMDCGHAEACHENP
jgi:hypothetical protein